MNCLNYIISDKLAAKLNTNQIHNERSAIFPGSSRSKTTTPKDTGWRLKLPFVKSSRDPDPQDMDYSDSGSSCQSTPTSRFSQPRRSAVRKK